MLTATASPITKIKTYSKLSDYEKKIILLAFLPATLVFLTFIGIIFIATPTFSLAVFHTSFLSWKEPVEKLSGIIVAALCLVFWGCLIGVVVVTRKMVNSFDHITNDLNEIIAGHSEEIIKTPPNDALTKELLKSVNVLVVRYLEQEKKKKAT